MSINGLFVKGAENAPEERHAMSETLFCQQGFIRYDNSASCDASYFAHNHVLSEMQSNAKRKYRSYREVMDDRYATR